MKNTVLKYVHELAPESKARVTIHFAAEVEEFSILISHMTQTLQNYHQLNSTHDKNEPKQVAYGLMTKGASTLMAGFELSLSGYLWEPSILFRNALETFATAWDIVHNESRFKRWKTNKHFKSTDSISSAKEVIEQIGKLHGHLSSMHAHIGPTNASPSCVMSGDEPKLQFFGLIRSGKEGIRAGEIHFSLLVAYMCLQLTELTFHQYAHELETIVPIPGSGHAQTKVSERHRKFMDAALQYFKTVLDDQTICF